MIIRFVTKSGSVAVIGEFLPLNKRQYKLFIRKFPIHWVGV